MPRFTYCARDDHGSSVRGVLDASSELECIAELASRDLSPIKIEARDRGARRERRRSTSVPSGQIMLFTRQLAAVHRAGIPLVEGLRLVEGNLENPELRRIIERVACDVEDGASLADAFSQHPAVFKPFYVSAVHAGQAAGNLQRVLEDLEEFLSEQIALRKDLAQALRYPAIVVASIVLAIVATFGFVIPKLAPMFERFDGRLPLPTKALLALESVVSSHTLVLLAGLSLTSIAFGMFARTPRGKRQLDAWKLRLPIVGTMIRYHFVARFAGLLAMLSHGGGALVRSLEITAEAMSNRTVQDATRDMRESILGGASISDAMAQHPVFPEMMVHLVRVGETSGRLEDFLVFLSDHYREECRYQTKHLVQWVEPALTLVLGIVVLFLAFAIFLPYWNMIQAFRGGGG